MRKKFLNLATALGLTASLFVGALGTASAAPEDPGQDSVYFPWVPHESTLAGIEGINGAVTIQNVEDFAVDVSIAGLTSDESVTVTLNPHASQTFTADQLGLAEGGEGVVATAVWAVDEDVLVDAGICTELADDVTVTATRGAGDSDTVELPEGAVAVKEVRQGNNLFEPEIGDIDEDGNVTITWTGDAAPAEGTEYTLVVELADNDCPAPRIAGVAKTTVGTVGAGTNADTEMVDGYTAVPLDDALASVGGGAVLEGQSRWILPIVQTNHGWNTEIVITNISTLNTSVNATLYVAEGQGVGGPSEALLSGVVLAPGESVSYDLAENGIEEGTVGSVWIDSTQPVTAVAFRNKVETNMMLTNVAQPRTDEFEANVKFAPLVFRDYNGWNTGINIANLGSASNQVTITLYNYAGNVVGVESINIPPRGMEYVYMPASGELGLGDQQISSAKIAGTQPLAAAVDEVKYLGGEGEGHAMSYLATAGLNAQLPALYDDGTPVLDENENPVYVDVDYQLALPLLQKGNARTGLGDTSGINLYNAGGNTAAATVTFYDSAGLAVAPTVNPDDSARPLAIDLPAGAGATLYTLNYSEMPAGLQGSAVVDVPAGSLLVGVSNNVNYAVDGDGSAVFSLSNVGPLGTGVVVGPAPDDPGDDDNGDNGDNGNGTGDDDNGNGTGDDDDNGDTGNGDGNGDDDTGNGDNGNGNGNGDDDTGNGDDDTGNGDDDTGTGDDDDNGGQP